MATHPSILFTSFATWRPHQQQNSSDQLLVELAQAALTESIDGSIYFLRQLPVNTPVAKDLLFAKIEQLQPRLIVCCGMAESRYQLNIERRAVVGNQILATDFPVEKVTQDLKHTVISDDAGRFVCNSLYHAMLNYLKCCSPARNGLFIHVPQLTSQNWEQIVGDFRLLVERLIAYRS